MNIQLKLNQAEIIFLIDAIKTQSEDMMRRLAQVGVEVELTKEQIEKEEKSEQTYVQNLESLVKELSSKAEPKKRRPKDAPYGYKKDGTPKKRPGRQSKK